MLQHNCVGRTECNTGNRDTLVFSANANPHVQVICNYLNNASVCSYVWGRNTDVQSFSIKSSLHTHTVTQLRIWPSERMSLDSLIRFAIHTDKLLAERRKSTISNFITSKSEPIPTTESMQISITSLSLRRPATLAMVTHLNASPSAPHS